MISNEKPRFPGTTLEDRQAVYKDVLVAASLQAVAATATIAMGEVRQDVILKSLFAVFNKALALAGPETLSINVVYAPAGGGANVNVAAAAVVFANATSGAGARLPIALDAAFVAGGNRIPAGSVLYAIRVLANGSVVPTNIVAAELVPAS